MPYLDVFAPLAQARKTGNTQRLAMLQDYLEQERRKREEAERDRRNYLQQLNYYQFQNATPESQRRFVQSGGEDVGSLTPRMTDEEAISRGLQMLESGRQAHIPMQPSRLEELAIQQVGRTRPTAVKGFLSVLDPYGDKEAERELERSLRQYRGQQEIHRELFPPRIGGGGGGGGGTVGGSFDKEWQFEYLKQLDPEFATQFEREVAPLNAMIASKQMQREQEFDEKKKAALQTEIDELLLRAELAKFKLSQRAAQVLSGEPDISTRFDWITQ